jgi:ribonucleoside-triphosphate reductase
MGTKEWGEVPEGIHMPIGKYIFNHITYSKHDPLVAKFRQAGYYIIEKPYEPESVLVRFPVKYENVPFTRQTVQRKNGSEEEVEINTESAVAQLEWYLLLQTTWCEQNVSNTVYYDPAEAPAIVDWLLKNWDSYVGISFIFRHDPAKNAEDLGYAYLPQETVTKSTYDAYVTTLREVDWSDLTMHDESLADQSCATGACPVR